MQLLKTMDISGYLYPAYGKLTLEYTFQNTADTPCAPRYFFPVPKDAIIGGLQLLTKNKTLIRGKFSPITSPLETTGDYRLFQVNPCVYCLSFEELLPNETCTVLLEVLVRLFPMGDSCRFVFPHYHNVPTSVNLTLHGMIPQGDIDFFDINTHSLSVNLSGTKDFVLDCNLTEQTSTAILEESFGGGLGFYRLYTKQSNTKANPITLLLDWAGITSATQINQIKELAFRIFSALPPNVPVNIPALLKKNIYSTEKTCQEIFEKLQNLSNSYAEDTDNNANTILITGNASSLSSPCHLLTVGEHTPLVSGLNTIHFYSKDINEETIKTVLPTLLAMGQAPEVIPEGSNVKEFYPLLTPAGNGYTDFVLSYTGQAPRSFTLQKDGDCLEAITLEHLSPMPHFPDAQKLYAMGKAKHLSALLQKVSPTSLRKMKQQLTETCLRYQIMGSEMVLTLDTGLNNLVHLPFYCFDALPHKPLPNIQKTIFGESQRKISDKEKLKEYCLTILYQSIRENGGIFSYRTLTPQNQGEETALAALALFQQNDARLVLTDAYGFLENVADCRWHFLLRTIRDGKPMMEEIFHSLPTLEELLSLLEEHPHSVKYAAMILLWLSK